MAVSLGPPWLVVGVDRNGRLDHTELVMNVGVKCKMHPIIVSVWKLAFTPSASFQNVWYHKGDDDFCCWNDLFGDIWDMWLWCWHTGDCSQFAELPSIGTIPWMLGMVMRILALCSCVNILNVKELEVKQIKNVWCEILKCDFGFWDQTCEGSIWVYVCVFTW